MLYRIEVNLRLYFWYSVGTFILNVFWWMCFVAFGSICSALVSGETKQMGSTFVCGFMDSFVFFGLLVVICITLYCLYIVWSAAEEPGNGGYPELLKYSSALARDEQ